jgi:hypothetical protein
MYFLRDSDGIFRISGRFLFSMLATSFSVRKRQASCFNTDFSHADVFLNCSDTDMFDCSIVVIFSRRLVVS